MENRMSLWRSVFRVALFVIVAVSLLCGAVPSAQSAIGQSGDGAVYADARPKPGNYYLGGKEVNGLFMMESGLHYYKKSVSQKGWQKIGSKKLYFKKVGEGSYALSKANIKSGFATLNVKYGAGSAGTYTARKQRFYFDPKGKLVVANSSNGHVIEDNGKYHYVHSSGAIDPDVNIMYFERFKNGAWIRVIESENQYGQGGVVMIRFGNRELGPQADKVMAGMDTKVADNGEGYVSTKEQYAELFRYNWPRNGIRVGVATSYARRYIQQYIGIKTISGHCWGAWGTGNEDED
jgi:hypothetical protein